MLSEMQPQNSLTEVCALEIILSASNMFVAFVANIWSHTVHEFPPNDVRTCLVMKSSNFLTQKEAHKIFRGVKFPMNPEKTYVEQLKTILSRLTMTPLRQGYPLENDGCRIHDALEMHPLNSLTNVCALEIILCASQMFAAFDANIWFHSIHEPSLSDVRTCLVIDNLQFLTQKGAHKN